MQNWYNKAIKISKDMSSTEAENERINRIRTALEEQEFPQFVDDVGKSVYRDAKDVIFQEIQQWATDIPRTLKLAKYNRPQLLEMLQTISSDVSKVVLQSGSGADAWNRFKSFPGWETIINEYIRNFIQQQNISAPTTANQPKGKADTKQKETYMANIHEALKGEGKILPQFIQKMGQQIFTKIDTGMKQKIQNCAAMLPDKVGLSSHNEAPLMEILTLLASDAAKVSIQNGQENDGSNTWQIFKVTGNDAINNYIEGFIHNVMPKATTEELAVIQSGK